MLAPELVKVGNQKTGRGTSAWKRTGRKLLKARTPSTYKHAATHEASPGSLNRPLAKSLLKQIDLLEPAYKARLNAKLSPRARKLLSSVLHGGKRKKEFAQWVKAGAEARQAELTKINDMQRCLSMSPSKSPSMRRRLVLKRQLVRDRSNSIRFRHSTLKLAAERILASFCCPKGYF